MKKYRRNLSPEKTKNQLKRRIQMKRENFRQRKIIAFHLHGGRCKDCGITDIRLIEWDHVRGVKNRKTDPSKITNINDYMDEVMNYCEPVCANCHRLRTWTRREDLPASPSRQTTTTTNKTQTKTTYQGEFLWRIVETSLPKMTNDDLQKITFSTPPNGEDQQ